MDDNTVISGVSYRQISKDTLVVTNAKAIYSLSIKNIKELRKKTEGQSKIGKGILSGALIGTFIGLGAGALMAHADKPDNDDLIFGDTDLSGVYIIMGGVGGLLAGGVGGAILSTVGNTKVEVYDVSKKEAVERANYIFYLMTRN